MLMLSISKNKLKINLFFLFFMFFTAPGVSFSASYQLSTDNNMQIHGFASQAFTYTNKNNFLGNSSDNGSFDFREIGMNVSLQTGQNLLTAVQLLSRKAGGFDDGKIKLDFALIDYRIKQASLYGFGIRAGRIKNPNGLYNDTRDVSFTRSTIILPQSIYFERTRDLSISSDGIQLYGHRDIQSGSMQLQLFAAQPRVEGGNTEIALFGKNRPGDITGNPSYIVRFTFKTHNNKLKLSFSSAMLNTNYEPTPTEVGFNGDATIKFNLNIFSVRLNHKQWSFTGEYASRKLQYTDMYVGYIPPFLANTTGESYYLQLSYRINYHWKLISRYDVLYQDRNDRDGSDYASKFAVLGVNKPAHARFAKDMTVGIQWSINTSWMIQLEFHAIDGTGWLAVQDNPDIDNAARKWRMFNAAVSYRF